MEHPGSEDSITVTTRDGVLIHVRTRGDTSGAPICFLLHGLGVGSGYWDLPVPGYNTMEYLVSRGIDVYAMDHRGYGQSGPASGETVTVPTAVGDVLAVIEAIQERHPGQPLSLVGHSWGGMVASAVAARDPERYSSLVCIGTPFRRINAAFAERVPFLRSMAEPVDGWLPNVTHLGLDQFLYAFDPEVLAAYQSLVESEYPRIPLGILSDCETVPHASAVEELRLPTLLICGNDELVVDRTDLLEVINAIPAADKDLLFVGNSGHLMGLEKLSHRRVDQAIADWVLNHAG